MAATLKEFISRVVPWPGAGSPGVVNMHWKAKSQNGNFFWGGRPQNSVDDFVSLARWSVGRPNIITDIYFCLSMQSQTGKYSRGKPGVARSADCAMALKAVWLDIDVKDPPKGYATRDEALRALDLFVKGAGLPFPTCIVASGGGLHVYWISDRALTVEEWRPYAEGLKAAAIQFGLRCDAGLTTDCARILRVPETFNHKTMPPKPVELLFLSPSDYDFGQALQKFALTGVTTITATVNKAPVKFDLSKFAGLKPAFNPGADHLGDGIKREDMPLDPRPIIMGCPFFKDAFKTHGKDHTQPLWNLAILATTFMEKGDVLAHEIGNAHPGYTVASTDAMFDRKSKEKVSKGLGWPSCKAIEGEGCKLCVGCPHFGKIKSPLNLAIIHPSPPASGSVLTPLALQAAQPPNMHLPKEYAVDPKTGIICFKAEVPSESSSPSFSLVPLFKCVLSDPWIQTGPRALNFKTTLDKGRIGVVSIPEEKFATLSLLTNELFKQGVLLNTQVETKVRSFIVDWKTEIQNKITAQKTVPFGWVIDEDGGEVRGFAYGGKIMHRKDASGNVPSDTASGYGDAEIRSRYAPQGSIAPWFNAMKMVTDQNRPDLEIVLATAFGAPLMEFVGKDMVTFAAFGESGAHKSSALKIAAAVWGHPKLTMEVHTSTTKGVLKRMGQIVNLPIYWDELSDESTIEHVFKTMFVGGQGIEGSTLASDRRSNTRGMWRTSLSINLNQSFVDFVAKRQRSTEAGVYRVFEYWVERALANTMTEGEASNLLQSLEYNYGQMGLAYAKLLSVEPDELRKFVIEQEAEWSKLVEATGPERNWVAACTVTLCGAIIANQILRPAGCAFHVNGMRQELYNSFMKMRDRLAKTGSQAGTFTSVRDVMQEWFRDTTENTIWTKTMNMGRGKPKSIEVVSGPNINRQVPIFSQFGIETRLLRVSRTEFVKWLNVKKYSPSNTLRGMANHFGVIEKEAYLASGTRYETTQERLIQFQIGENSPLEQMLFSKSANEDKPAYLLDNSTEEAVVEETGIAAATTQAQKDLAVVKSAA